MGAEFARPVEAAVAEELPQPTLHWESTVFQCEFFTTGWHASQLVHLRGLGRCLIVNNLFSNPARQPLPDQSAPGLPVPPSRSLAAAIPGPEPNPGRAESSQW